VGIVTYESAVDVRAPLQRLTGAGREALHATLDTIEVAGSTALAGGWCTGRDQLQAGATDRLCRVLLLSDGLANEGEQRVEVLGAWCREARDRGITTSTVGIG
jgi:Ca-activated chloride channel family protein